MNKKKIHKKMAKNLNGWVSLNRKFLDWQFFDDPKAVKTFVYLLLTATPKDYKVGEIAVKRGQVLTTVLQTAKNLGFSRQELRTILSKFQMAKIIDIQSHNRYSLVTICKYDFYQKNGEKINQQNNQQNNQQKNQQNNQQINQSETNTTKDLKEDANQQKNQQKNQQNNQQNNQQINHNINNNINNNSMNKNICCSGCIANAEELKTKLNEYVLAGKYNGAFVDSFFKWYTKKDAAGKMRFQKLEFTDLDFYLNKWEKTTKEINKINNTKQAGAKKAAAATLNPETVAFMTAK